MAQDFRKSELIATLAEARRGILINVRGLGDDLNVVRRIETAFQRHRVVWLAGAGLLGFIVARLPGGQKKVVVVRKGPKADAGEKVVKAGLLVTSLKIAFNLARPALTRWLTSRVAAYADQRFAADPRPQ